VSAEIVRKSGSSIRFRSSTTPGRNGTVFSIFLPVSVAPDLETAA